MNLKNVLKNVDYKGLALQHCEKAVIVVVTALLLMFLINGFKKAVTASSVTPERIDQLAANLDRSVRTSEWNDSVAEKEQVKNPPFEAQIAKLMSGVRPDQFTLAQLFFHFVDYGGILRQKPDIVTPYHPLAKTDKGAVALYKLNSKGEYIEKEIVARSVPKPKPAEDDSKKKKALALKTPAKGGKGMSMSEGGGGDIMDRYRGGKGMGGMSGMGGAMGPEGGGMAISGSGGDDLSGMQGFVGASRNQNTKSIRRSARKTSDESIYDSMDEQQKSTDKPGDKTAAKAPVKRMVREEEIKGVRWALVTALLQHREQVKKYVEALHTTDDPPDYKKLKVERREVLSDGSLSEWDTVPVKRLADIVKRLPERYVPEDPAVKSAKADFAGLMMKLPELEIGDWSKYVRAEAHDSAAEVAGGGARFAARRGGRDGGDEGMVSGDDDSSDLGDLFGAGAQSGGGGVSSVGGPIGAGGGMAGGMAGLGGGAMSGRGGMVTPTTNAFGPSAGGGGRAVGQQGGRTPQPPPAARKTQGPAAPPVQKCDAEIVQVRFVDYTVEPEHTYQYRLKVVVRNPNYNRLDVINAEAASEEELSSDEWSEPTPLVYIPPDLEYYVMDRVRAREEAKLQVHVWPADTGDWQYSDFTIKPGDPIGSRVRDYQLVGWEDPPKIKKTDFDFSTQDLLLDVTGGDKPFLFEVDGVEIKFTERLPTEIFVIDRLGDLAVRNDDFDRNNVDRIEREKYIKEVKEKAKAGEDKESKKSGPGAKAESGSREDFEGRSAPSRRDGPDR